MCRIECIVRTAYALHVCIGMEGVLAAEECSEGLVPFADLAALLIALALVILLLVMQQAST